MFSSVADLGAVLQELFFKNLLKPEHQSSGLEMEASLNFQDFFNIQCQILQSKLRSLYIQASMVHYKGDTTESRRP